MSSQHWPVYSNFIKTVCNHLWILLWSSNISLWTPITLNEPILILNLPFWYLRCMHPFIFYLSDMADRYNVKLTMIFWQIFNIFSTISTGIVDRNRLWLSCLGPLVSCSLSLLNYLAFQYFDINRNWLFQKR